MSIINILFFLDTAVFKTISNVGLTVLRPVNSNYTFIKICGLTSAEDAREASILGADLLGMVMHPKSPRVCNPSDALEIIRASGLKPTVLVFADNEIRYARDLIHELAGDLTLVQAPCESKLFTWLLDNYPVEKILPVYSVPVSSSFNSDTASRKTGEGENEVGYSLLEEIDKLKNHPWVILDTGGVISKNGETLYGGTGQTFDWSLVRGLGRKYFLAGGLKPENIAEAISMTRAPGYDVSSGIESRPGKKDFDKMKSLISQIRESRKNQAGDFNE